MSEQLLDVCVALILLYTYALTNITAIVIFA